MRRALSALLGLFLGLILASSVAACTRGALPDAARQTIDVSRIDPGLFDAAMLRETNYLRCQKGLRALAPGPARLVGFAMQHSAAMAKAQRLTHKSGGRDAQARVQASGVRPKAGSENIGQLYRFRIDGLSFKINDAARCRFSTWGGAPLGPHSYETLAMSVTGFWARSPSHAVNLFNRRYTNVSSAVAYEPGGPHCGRMWITQTFYR